MAMELIYIILRESDVVLEGNEKPEITENVIHCDDSTSIYMKDGNVILEG